MNCPKIPLNAEIIRKILRRRNDLRLRIFFCYATKLNLANSSNISGGVYLSQSNITSRGAMFFGHKAKPKCSFFFFGKDDALRILLSLPAIQDFVLAVLQSYVQTL